jgi:hypothetical protein
MTFAEWSLTAGVVAVADRITAMRRAADALGARSCIQPRIPPGEARDSPRSSAVHDATERHTPVDTTSELF